METVKLFSRDQIAQYHEDGFVVYKGLFNSGQLKEIEAGLTDVATRRQEYPKGKFIMEDLTEEEINQLPPLASVRKINQLQSEPWAMNFWGAPSKARQLCAELTGKDDLLMMGLFVFAKPAKHGSSTPWHQDQSLWQFFAPESISCWTAIDPCTEENGYLQFYRAGHKEGLIPHIFPKGAPHLYIEEEKLDPARIVAVPMEPGDAVFFNGLTPHFSEINRSEVRRIGMPCVYGSESEFRMALANSQWLKQRLAHNLRHIIDEEFITSRQKEFGH
ncbi:MAG: phytanoyl-CoA dioxygenase [Paenibacillaceae bacterium]|jgi:phytanoyl-CoA hydroxylase|nr:phytanoyl-CoA dioxygenase [Paenibacillaceae bacterium]